MYNVVYENISGSNSHGVITWTSYTDEADFKKSQKRPNMKKWYKVVKEDVTVEEAVRICSGTKATLALVSSMFIGINQTIKELHDIFIEDSEPDQTAQE